MEQHLVITTIGSDRPGISHHMITLVTQAGCNIIDSRIALFGSEFTLIMLVSGSTNAIAHVETGLPLLGQQHDLITMTKRTAQHTQPHNAYTMEVHVQADDKIGLTEKFTQFFSMRNIGMSSLSAQTIDQSSVHQELRQFYIAISAQLNDDYNLMQLQEEFIELCDQSSVQGSINFIKNSQ